MRRIYRLCAMAATCAAALSLMGCPKGKQSTGGDTGRLTIAVIPKGTVHSFWQLVKAGAEAAGKEEGVTINFVGPDKETAYERQINILENQVTSGVNGVVLAATDANALVKPVQDAMAKGIPVVTIDSGLAQPISDCYIATDNVKGGELAAKKLAELVGDKGSVGQLRILQGTASSDQREQGFNAGMKEHPGVSIAETLQFDSDPGKANDRTMEILTAHPDVVGIFAANEPGGVGAANALRQKKLQGKVKLVAFDMSKEEIAALQDGTIQALIVQNPYKMGYDGVKTVLKAIRKQPIENKTVDSGVTVVTKENFNTPEVQKLIHP
jgi:ribose transport system substrate-binding protein